MQSSRMSSAVRIPLNASPGECFFDLNEVMDAVGEHHELAWSLHRAYFNGDVTAVWPDGPDDAERRSNEPGGLAMSWASMRRLASRCQQIIDGDFLGCTLEGQPRLAFAVVDSSYWVVWSAEDSVISLVRDRFVAAQESDTPPPSVSM